MNEALHRRRMDVATAVVKMAARASRDFISQISGSEMLSKIAHIVDHHWERRRARARLLRRARYQPICRDNGARFVAQMRGVSGDAVLRDGSRPLLHDQARSS